jgi:hypothetical protein
VRGGIRKQIKGIREMKVRRWMPSNGTEGMIFMEHFCSECIHERWMHHQNEDKGKCEILSNSMLHDRPCWDKDLKFDGWEWFCNEDLTGWKCNQHKPFDWGNDRDGWNEPPEIIPDDPNQLILFSFDEKLDDLIKQEKEECVFANPASALGIVSRRQSAGTMQHRTR